MIRFFPGKIFLLLFCLLALGCRQDKNPRQIDISTVRGKIDGQKLMYGKSPDPEQVTDVMFGPDGDSFAFIATKWKSGTANSYIGIGDAGSGKVLHEIREHDGLISGIDFSADGSELASCGQDNLIIIRSTETGEVKRTLKGHLPWAQYAGISNDGTTLVAKTSRMDKLNLISSSTGELISTIDFTANNIQHHNFKAFSMDDSIVFTTGGPSEVCLWSTRDGRLIAREHLTTSSVTSIATSPDNRILACGSSVSRLYIFDMKDFTQLYADPVNGSLSGNVDYVKFSPDGKFIACDGLDKSISIWSMDDKKFIQNLKNKVDIASITFSHVGNFLAVATLEPSIQIWNAEEGTLVKTIKGPTREMKAIAFTNDDKKIAYCELDRLGVISVDSEKRDFEVATERNEPSDMVLSDDGKNILMLMGNEAFIFTSSNGNLIKKYGIVWGGVNDVVYSPDGRYLVSCGGDKTVRIWSAADGELLRTFPNHREQVWTVDISPDSRLVASIDQDDLMIWDIENGENIQAIRGGFYKSNALRFSPGGKSIAASNGNLMSIWSLDSGKKMRDIQALSLPVESFAFSHDEKCIAIVYGEKYPEITVFATDTGEFVKKFQDHKNGVLDVEYSPDGRFLISGGSDLHVKIWDVESGKLVKSIKA
jgi:WD40 repeat protein